MKARMTRFFQVHRRHRYERRWRPMPGDISYLTIEEAMAVTADAHPAYEVQVTESLVIETVVHTRPSAIKDEHVPTHKNNRKRWWQRCTS